MLNKLHCRLPNLESEAFVNSVKREFEKDPDGLTDMQKRVKHLKDIVNITKSGSGSASDQASELVFTRMRNTQDLLSQINITPDPSKASNAYKFYLEVGRKAKGRLDELLARLEVEQKLLEVDQKARYFKDAYNVSDADFGLAKVWGAEIGWQPYIGDYASASPNTYIYLKNEQKRFYDFMSRELKFSNDDIGEFADLMSEPAKVYHEVLLVTRDLGITVDDLGDAGVGFIPREYSKDYIRRLEWKYADDGNFREVKFADDSSVRIEDAFINSRNSYEFIVEDEVVLDYLLRHSVKKGLNVYEELGKAVGDASIKGIKDVLTNDVVLSEALMSVLTDGQISYLIESGLVRKLPVTTDRIYKTLVKGLKLPYSSVNDLLSTDFKQGFGLYKRQLETLVSDAQSTWALVSASVKDGWGVTESVVKANTEDYADWVRLSEVIPDNLKTKFGLTDVPTSLRSALDETFVHPTVARQYASELTLLTDPVNLGVIGHGLNFLKRFNTTMWLSTSQFVGRQFINNATQLFSAGGSMLDFVGDTVKATYSMVRGVPLLDSLDDVHKSFTLDGVKITEKELYLKLIGTGYINDYTQAAEQLTGKSHVPSTFDAHQMKRVFKQMSATWNAYPDYFKKVSRLTQTGLSYADELINGQIGAPFRLGNVMFENLAKFSLAKTVFSNGKYGSLLTGSYKPMTIKTLNEFVDYSADFFYWYDTTGMGKLGKAVSYVVPFFSYRTKNLAGTWKQVLHNPTKFGNYLEIYAALNAPMEKEDIPRGGVPDYIMSSNPIVFKIDKNTSGMEHDAFFYFPTSSLIQQSGAVADFNKLFDVIGVPLIENKTPLETNPTQEKKNVVQKLIDDESWTWAKFAKAVLTGEDPESDYPISSVSSKQSTILGVPVSPWTKYALELFFPPIERLDKWNPNGVFGQSAYYDQYNKEFIEASPSWLGAERNTRSSSDVPIRVTNDWTELFGIKANFIDLAYNMGATKDEVKGTIYDNIKVLKSIRRNIKASSTDSEKQRLEVQYELIRSYTVALSQEHRRLDNWLRMNGFTTRAGLRYLKEQGISIQHLPNLSEKERDDVMKDIHRQLVN